MASLNLFKFKRGLVPKNQIIAQALLLGLENEPSFQGANCCFIKNKWLTFGETGSTSWNNAGFTEITEEEFMKLTTLD